jgi:hypothetical protein
MIHDLLGSSHKFASVSVNRHLVRFIQLLDGQHKFACSPSPWNLGKRKVLAANVPASLFAAVRFFVFFELKRVFPHLEKPEPTLYLESRLSV